MPYKGFGTYMKKIICVADWHIGYKKSNYDAIHRSLDYIEENRSEIKMLILNGDCIDLWRCPYKKIRETPVYNEAFERLQTIANRMKVIYIRGNHDYMADKIIGDDLNVEYKRMFIHENVCYLHGDQFVFMQIESLFAFVTRRCNFISRHVNNIFTKSNIPNSFVKKIEKFQTDNFFEHVVVAHTHIHAIYKGIVFCGSAIEHLSYIEISDEKIKIKKI